jgi:hypothetical protein
MAPVRGATTVGARRRACDIARAVASLAWQRAAQGVGIVAIRGSRLRRPVSHWRLNSILKGWLHSRHTSPWLNSTASFRRASPHFRCTCRTWQSPYSSTDSHRHRNPGQSRRSCLCHSSCRRRKGHRHTSEHRALRRFSRPGRRTALTVLQKAARTR